MLDTEHPSMGFHCPMTQEHITLSFGYLTNAPMMPVFKGDDHIMMIPREVLIAALSEGWGGTESGWWVDPSNN